MAQVVGRWPLTAESRIRFKNRPCRIGSGERRTGTDITVNTSLCIFVSVEIFSVIYIYIYFTVI